MRKSCYYKRDFIDRLFDIAEVVEFDKSSKLVFISDCHRGDGGNADSLRQNKNIYKAALGFYLRNEYTLIELGDGDELWKNKDCLEIAYNYKDIFKIFNRFYEENRLYMVIGNHDIIKKNPDFIKKQEKAFAQVRENFGREFLNLYKKIKFHEAIRLRYTPFNKNILAFHGHQCDFMNCQLWKYSRFLVRYIWRAMEGIGGFKEPISPSSNYNKGSIIDRNLEKIARSKKTMFICGHTHNDTFPKPGKGLYFNDGCCVFPSTITCIEIVDGKISLVKWSIEVDKCNSLFISKEIVGGPEDLEKYLDYASRL